MAKSKKLAILLNGIIKENPVLVLVLGTCPTLAVTTQTVNAFGMGAAATAVLLFSNVAISLLRKIIPDKVRIPCYIVLIAAAVTIVQMVLNAFVYNVYEALGLFLPLIVVNCIILGRAEMFANKNTVVDSALDAIGMGIGFTLTLFVMASIREIFGAGTWMGYAIPILKDNHIGILTMAPGGFCIFGILIAVVNKFFTNKPKKSDFGCEGCPSAAACGKVSCTACAEEKKEVAAE
ncbi:MAG: electron transport complex subunit E [Oscillospiraceae bacterium]|nr:electron transport complex subunit E [Oscillospiraceae bacterium]MBR5261347.1 electron transport complex subunit E [Oscillospiraceae bacterium]